MTLQPSTPIDDARVTVGLPPEDPGPVDAGAAAGDVDDLPDTVPTPVAALAPARPTRATTTRTPPTPTPTSTTPATPKTPPTTSTSPTPPTRVARATRAEVDAALAAAQGLYVRGRFADAIAVLLPVERRAPDDARVHKQLGLYNAKLRRIDEARRHLSRYLELAADAPDAARVRAQLDRL